MDYRGENRAETGHAKNSSQAILTKFIKSFSELTTYELYDMLQLRSEVFVVEQNCVYQDIDGKDNLAYHAFMYEKTNLVAYARIFSPGDYFEDASIGRVVVSPKFRGQNQGIELMKFCMEFAFAKTKHRIIISAQQYLLHFYTSLGFVAVGEGYLEDDIPHIKMEATKLISSSS